MAGVLLAMIMPEVGIRFIGTNIDMRPAIIIFSPVGPWMIASTTRCDSHISASLTPAGSLPSFLNSARRACAAARSSSVVNTVRKSMISWIFCSRPPKSL